MGGWDVFVLGSGSFEPGAEECAQLLSMLVKGRKGQSSTASAEEVYLSWTLREELDFHSGTEQLRLSQQLKITASQPQMFSFS